MAKATGRVEFLADNCLEWAMNKRFKRISRMYMRSLADAFDTSFGNEIGRRILGELTCQLRTSNLGHWTPNCWQRKRNCTARIMQEAEDVLGWRECMCNLVETKELIRSSFYLTPFDRRQTDLRLSLRLTTWREPSNCRPIQDTDLPYKRKATTTHPLDPEVNITPTKCVKQTTSKNTLYLVLTCSHRRPFQTLTQIPYSASSHGYAAMALRPL